MITRALLLLAALSLPLQAQRPDETGTIAGTVLNEAGGPVSDAQVHAARTDGRLARDAVSDAKGEFRIAGLGAGFYTLSVRHIGFRAAEHPELRVTAGHVADIRVLLVQSARQLSTVRVVSSATTVEAGTPAISTRVDVAEARLLPTTRDIAGLVALVPGAKRDQLWGGAGAPTNNNQLDGVSVNHPGVGGDFLLPSVDWIETLEIQGLGAGAEHGNFQGGLINAITRSGTNRSQFAMRANLEAPQLTGTNLTLNEDGSEQAGRREVSGEALGPIFRDRLFYFFGGQLVDRDVRVPNLLTVAPSDFGSVQENHHQLRAIGKLTWLPSGSDRVDLLAGRTEDDAEHLGITGVDDPASSSRERSPTTYYEGAYTRTFSSRSIFDLRFAGFDSRDQQSGYQGSGVPGFQLYQLGRQPSYGNAAFDEDTRPSSLSLTTSFRRFQHALGMDHQVVIGGEASRGRWKDNRIRNGGLTWRPYPPSTGTFDPNNPASWTTVGSDWGGDIRLNSRVGSEAAYIQDYISIGTRLTLAPGLRWGRWSGWLTPTSGPEFMAVRDDALDPRIGATFDVTGHSDFVVKAHWGRYHQGMASLFFDRARGSDVYDNQRYYYWGPALTSSRTTYTPEFRDSHVSSFRDGTNFSSFYDTQILNETGRVEGYRQPYVDQVLVGLEKGFGPAWKVELSWTRRDNQDMVGLVDRNLASNYQVLHNVQVQHRLGVGPVYDANVAPLVIPNLYVLNSDVAALLALQQFNGQHPLVGYTFADIPRLTSNQDIVLGVADKARRHYDQATLALHTDHPRWGGQGSLTWARLTGNVAGVNSYGTVASKFTAGPFVRPNELTNSDGQLPGTNQFEGKLWLTSRLTKSLQGGMFFTHVMGERFTPTFLIQNRYRYVGEDLKPLDDLLFTHILGQNVFTEARGDRNYSTRDQLDLRLEWSPKSRQGFLLTAEAFNVMGSNTITAIKTDLDDSFFTDKSSFFGATRQRMAPRTIRLGLRVER